MKQKSYKLMYRISLGMMIGAVSLRLGIDAVGHCWAAKHLRNGRGEIHYLDREGGRTQAIYVGNREGDTIRDCTDFLLQFTWVEIVRKILQGIAAAGIVLYTVFDFCKGLSNKDAA